MDVEKGSDEGENRGTKRRPFKTEEAVAAKLENWEDDIWDTAVYCSCSKDKCPLGECSFEGCRTKICDDHGVGKATYNEDCVV